MSGKRCHYCNFEIRNNVSDDTDMYLMHVTAAHKHAEDDVHTRVHSATLFSLSDVATPDGATFLSRDRGFVAVLTLPHWATLVMVPLQTLKWDKRRYRDYGVRPIFLFLHHLLENEVASLRASSKV
jgi:hypothetical protein